MANLSESFILQRFDDIINSSESTQRSHLCGFLPFCSSSPLACSDVVIIDCDDCSVHGAVTFALLVNLLVLAIILANGFLIWTLTRKGKPKGNYEKLKLSLAVSDAITGVHVLIVMNVNFNLTIHLTADELNKHQLQQNGSPQAIVGGILYILTYSASMSHLILLAGQRLVAVGWPIRYKQQRPVAVNLQILCAWVLALASAAAPLSWPDDLVFTYSHSAFLFSVTAVDHTRTRTMALFMVTLFVLPYLVMTVLLAGTFVLVQRSRPTSILHQGSSTRFQASVMARERRVLKTIVLMVIGYTLTLVPIVTVAIFTYVGVLGCEGLSSIYPPCLYLSIGNSLANVIVYSFRDEHFKKSLKELFCKRCPRIGRMVKKNTIVMDSNGTSLSQISSSV